MCLHWALKLAKDPLLDGLGESTKAIVQVSNAPDADVAKVLKAAGAEVMVNLLPSGASKATQWYAEQALAAGCAFVNATPNFIASDACLGKTVRDAKLPLVGDDLGGSGWLNSIA